MCHTNNGRIRMKKSARKAGKNLNSDEKDKGIGNWLTISSPNDWLQYNVDVSFKKLGY